MPPAKSRQQPKAVVSAAPKKLGSVADAQTLIYVHGAGNKPKPSILKAQWDRALLGFDLGERSRMAYWVNRDRFPETLLSKSRDQDAIPVPVSARSGVTVEERRKLDTNPFLEPVYADVSEIAAGGPRGSEKVLQSAAEFWLKAYVGAGGRMKASAKAGQAVVARHMVLAALPALFDYLYVPHRREVMQQAVLDALMPGGGPFVVIAHGIGALIACDVLSRHPDNAANISLLVLIASPDVVPEVAAAWHARGVSGTIPVVRHLYRCVNTGDPLSGALLVQDTSPISKLSLVGEKETPDQLNASGNPRRERSAASSDEWFRRHAATAYLALAPLRELVRTNTAHGRLQRLGRVTLTRDLVRAIEDALGDEKTEVLFELTQPEGATETTIDAVRRGTVKALTGLVAGVNVAGLWSGKDVATEIARLTARQREALAAMEITPLRHYVGAWLTRGQLYAAVATADYEPHPDGGVDADDLKEVESVVNRRPRLKAIYRAWRNGRKYALISRSSHTVQAFPARESYAATGRGIEWAVLDTGLGRYDARQQRIRLHSHFFDIADKSQPDKAEDVSTLVASRWDCTRDSRHWHLDRVAEPQRCYPTSRDGCDSNGHGTHVAGIITGWSEVSLERGISDRRDNADGAGSRALARDGLALFRGIAAETRIHTYKVLNDDGEGSDSWIIKALDHIEHVNERAGKLQIAGVNLSLAGPFDTEAFGCGHTPLCDALRRLWRQGVVVVLAAGNSGQASLLTEGDGADHPDSALFNMSMSIEDPANLEEAIAVGSVHRVKPHTYGISHFSSRGPTADGRQKPDCVAPGEQILSCRHDWVDRTPARRQKAAPHQMNDLFVAMDGTSMAAPHVSGIIAAFLSMRREFIGQPERVKEILLRSCTDLGRTRSMQGAGLPNLMKMLLET